MRLVINSQFFLDQSAWMFLAERGLPRLIEHGQPLRAWSAGCSTGKEPFSLRLIASENLLRPSLKIYASDCDERAILAAKRGGPYSERDLELVSHALRSRYFTQVEHAVFVTPEIAASVDFEVHDLLRDAFPQRLDLILYRNLESCFSIDENRRIWEGFYRSLRPGGILFVGAADLPPAGLTTAFRKVEDCFYEAVPPPMPASM